MSLSRPRALRRAPFAIAAAAAGLVAVCAGAAGPTERGAGPVAEAIITHALADTFARDILRELCDEVGPRLAGSEGMRRAHAWALRSLREAGADSVWTEPVTVPRWERGRESARLVAPYEAPLAMLGLGRSEGTGPEGIEAEVLAVRDWAEFAARAAEAEGKIVLFAPPWQDYGTNVEYRSRAASRAARHGALAVLIRPAGFGHNTPHTGVMRYEDDAPRIPAASLTEEGAALLARLSRAGLAPRVELVMEARNLEDGPCANVVGELRGRERPEEIVLVGAHLDAWDTGGGAHDDGGGCAIMVAALATLRDLDLRPRRTVRVVLFTSEEYGGHGGRAYVEAHAGEVARHVLALESDSGTFAPAGFSVRADSLTIAALESYAASLARLGADSLYAGWAGVDIGPLVEQGVLGVGHRVHGDEYFRYHHSPADTWDAVRPDDLAANVAAVAAFVYAVADSPDPLPRPKDR
ncbi:MAG TPA: M20/M25/M40 family metallo-hydrolase [Candidatus Krumholzibacteria bacterium]|nr:M20/M25/M40 family metallo-hydrolase [Candidatus Krumholzibacteria bacterium]HPD71932.1 M20/M25/M40 family metallo-hydrolase [Candidatus Krumholzibacteria bacterium]HRY41135.1 M20/M25/M40 family metallo-hydrolase [Candidatus Krumholzibacteria bacterium]